MPDKKDDDNIAWAADRFTQRYEGSPTKHNVNIDTKTPEKQVVLTQNALTESKDLTGYTIQVLGKKRDNVTSDDKVAFMDKTQFLQFLGAMAATIAGVVIALMAIVVPLLSGRTDAQYESVKTEIHALSDKFDNMNQMWQDHQQMYERVVDEKIKKK